MRKRRNAKNNHHRFRGGGSNSGIIGHGDGDTTKKDKLSVFDFADDDERVEMDSRKSLLKFETKTPSKKPAHHRLDRYDFLSYDSDDDGMMEMRSTTFSFDLAENEGSVEELSSEYGVNANDCRCIRLEGSPLCEKKGHHCLERSVIL